MKLFQKFTEIMGRRVMWREARLERNTVVRNLHEASKVGIIYHAADEAAFNQVKNYVKKIKQDVGIVNIMALAYVDNKHLPGYLNSKLNFDQFTLADMNWYQRPSGNTVENFIAEEYEVLIDLSLDDMLPIQFIVGRSRARFKVGRYSDDNERLLDMMIDVAGGKSLAQLVTQIDHYLQMINAKQHDEHALV